MRMVRCEMALVSPDEMLKPDRVQMSPVLSGWVTGRRAQPSSGGAGPVLVAVMLVASSSTPQTLPSDFHRTHS